MALASRHAILIVEDERIVAKDLQLSLIELGYDAFGIASSAEHAIEQACARCPDLVLMDIRIKGQRDGVETAALLKRQFGVPIVFLTAHADEATVDRAKTVEPHGYLVKPVRAAELRSVVEVSLYKHQMERRLRERERWFSTTLRSIADAVIAVDLVGNVSFMNPAAEDLTGVTASEALGKAVHQVFRLVDDLKDPEGASALQALQEGRSIDLREATLLNMASGRRAQISDSAAPVFDEGASQALGAVMVFRDITEQKRLQKQLELADRLASLGTMAAGVAHEINNPLAVVVANAGFLANELKTLDLRETGAEELERRLTAMALALEDTQSAASRVGRIVSELRSFSRPEIKVAGTIDVLRCLDWAVRSTGHEVRQHARLVTHLGRLSPVLADETKLGQVFINLLLNAAQAIAPGAAEGNEIVVSACDRGSNVVVEVRDSGMGMTEETRLHVFEPFFTTKPVGVGTGLGLSICHGIVRSIGGDIQIESSLGTGTTVRVVLPIAAAQVALPQPAPAADALLRGTVLVIDDAPLVARALGRILKHHQTLCLEDAREALTQIEAGATYDLILCDLMMPNMTGIAFYERLLSTHPDLARRVVFLTGGAITSHSQDFLRSVPNGHIEKPFQVAELQSAVQRMITAHRTGRSSA